MALTLHVDSAAWHAMVDATWAEYGDVVPVVKGNGYGFGRGWLAQEAARRGATQVAVGTIYEVAHLGALNVTPIVLTPSLDLDSARVPPHVVLTVGSMAQIDHLVRHRPAGPAVLKIATSVLRHGVAPHEVGRALDRLRRAGVEVHSVSIHPALVGTPEERRLEIESIVPAVPDGLAISVSHLDVAAYQALRKRHARHSFTIRLGSKLWHQDKATLHLRAKVLDTRPVLAGVRAGYHGVRVPGDGTIVIIDAGTSHGVAPLANGDSPFHFARRRLALIEPPHMHVSMAFVPNGDSCPAPGDEVDVQRPLLSTDADRIIWH